MDSGLAKVRLDVDDQGHVVLAIHDQADEMITSVLLVPQVLAGLVGSLLDKAKEAGRVDRPGDQTEPAADGTVIDPDSCELDGDVAVLRFGRSQVAFQLSHPGRS